MDEPLLTTVPRGEQLPAPLLVLTAIASVQIGSALAARLFDRAGPAGVVLLRLGFAALVLLAVSRPAVRGRSRRALGLAAAFGVALAGMNWSFYEALSRIPLGPAVTVEFVGPLAVAVAGSRRALDLVWVLLAGAGVVLLTSGGISGVTAAGVGLAALAGSLWAAYILLSQRIGQAFPGVSGLALALVVGALLMLPAGTALAGGRLLSAPVLAGGAAVALLSSVVPYSLELTALRRLPSRVFGVLMSLEPAMAAAAGAVVLGQHLVARELVAMGCVVAASAGATLTASRIARPVD